MLSQITTHTCTIAFAFAIYNNNEALSILKLQSMELRNMIIIYCHLEKGIHKKSKNQPIIRLRSKRIILLIRPLPN